MNWDEAKSWVKSLNIDGGGWRMPTVDELRSLFIRWKPTNKDLERKDFYKIRASQRNMTTLLKTSGWFVWTDETVSIPTGFVKIFSFRKSGKEKSQYPNKKKFLRAFAVRSSDKLVLADEKNGNKGTIIAKKKYKTYFSFEGINWNETPEQIADKLESLDASPSYRQGKIVFNRTASVSDIGAGGYFEHKHGFSDKQFISAIDDPNFAFLRKKKPGEHKNNIKLLQMNCKCESKTGSFEEIVFWFSSVDKQLVNYMVKTKIIGHELLKSLSKKYGPPSKILDVKFCGTKKFAIWKKNGQSLVWFADGDPWPKKTANEIAAKIKDKNEKKQFEKRFEKCKQEGYVYRYKDAYLLYLNNEALKPIADKLK